MARILQRDIEVIHPGAIRQLATLHLHLVDNRTLALGNINTHRLGATLFKSLIQEGQIEADKFAAT